MDRVAEIISARIEERGTTIVFVAKRAHMSGDALSKSLNGYRKLKADEFIELCRVLDLTFEDFQMPQGVAS